jgi:hypothetical protein
MVFANRGDEELPHGRGMGYPYHYDDLRLTKIVDLIYVDRYDGLLVADELEATRGSVDLREGWSERVQLRYLDLDARRILPWIKALPHAEANQMQNDSLGQIASYWHRGSMAMAQDSASLFWVEHDRSRVFQIADGMFEVAKSGNHHTPSVTVPILMPISGVAFKVAKEFRPDRFLDRRLDPFERRGPFVAVLIGSSLSSMSDRYTNYSFGRRLELELQQELGYRHGIRLDLMQFSKGAASFRRNLEVLTNSLDSSVPPDVVFIEAHDFANAYLKDLETSAEVNQLFGRLQELKDRYDTLVIFYDLSFAEGSRRESMRATNKDTRAVLRKARRLGYAVLEPGDWLFSRLLRDSPWGNQPFADNHHHPSPWAVREMSETFAFMALPYLVKHFEARQPARTREKLPSAFREESNKPPLRLGITGLEMGKEEGVRIGDGYVQTRYANEKLSVFVDLSGFEDRAPDQLDAIARAVLWDVLGEDVFADVARELRLELVEFSNYDEYGEGVVDSATTRWEQAFDHRSLREFFESDR